MKSKFYLYAGISSLIPLIVIFIILPFIPNEIPVHYGNNNTVTRYGSKYEMFIIPITTIFIYFIMYSYSEGGQFRISKETHKILTIFVLIIFYTINILFIYTIFSNTEDITQILIIMFVSWAVLLGIVGGIYCWQNKLHKKKINQIKKQSFLN